MLDSQYSVNRLESVTFSPPGTPLVIVAKEHQTFLPSKAFGSSMRADANLSQGVLIWASSLVDTLSVHGDVKLASRWTVMWCPADPGSCQA